MIKKKFSLIDNAPRWFTRLTYGLMSALTGVGTGNLLVVAFTPRTLDSNNAVLTGFLTGATLIYLVCSLHVYINYRNKNSTTFR